METHRNGFVPCLNHPQYNQCHARITPHPPTETILPRDPIPLNRSPIRHVAAMSPQCSITNVNLGPHPTIGHMVPPMYNPTPRLAAPIAPHLPPQAYYAYPTRPHFHNRYETSPVNSNANLSSKNFVKDYRAPSDTPAPVQSRWIKPTIFYDGFWTEQKVKKWISEQFIEESSLASSSVDNKARHINRAH